MSNYNAVVGINVRKIKISAENSEKAKQKIEAQLQPGEKIFDLSESTGSAESG